MNLNFSRAASQLGYHQSTVTFHIKSLERELGVRLFERQRFSKSIAIRKSAGVLLNMPNGYWRSRQKRKPSRSFLKDSNLILRRRKGYL